MRTTAFALLLCGILAGCSQTTTSDDPVATGATSTRPAPRTAGKAQGCDDAIRKASSARQNAMVGGALLSAAGGFGGYAGHGGAIIGQAASIGGSMIQQQAARDANRTVFEECR